MINERIVCTYLYIISKHGYPPKAENTLEYIKGMKDLGFQSIELEGIREEHLMKVYGMKDRIADELKGLNLSLPYFCTVLPGLSTMDGSEKKKQLELFEKGCETAKLLGAKGVLDNAPMPPYEFPDDIPIVRHYGEKELAAAFLPKDLSWTKYWDNLIESFRTVCDIADKYGLTYQVHPAHGLLSSTTDSFLYFFDAVKRDNLRFNFDTANQFFLKDNLALGLRRLKDHIDYIHISDNGGTRVEHLSVGDGVINWNVFLETLELIDFKGVIGLDIGGDESGIDDLDKAYLDTADYLTKNWLNE